MSSMIKKGHKLVKNDGTVLYCVTRTHRDGTVSVRSLCFLNDDGTKIPGYLGFGNSHVSLDAFQALVAS